MFCSNCGFELAGTYRFCPQCGTPATSPEAVPGSPALKPRLTRPLYDKQIAGVCSGLARFLGVDVTLIRILAVVFAIYPPGLAVLIYLVCWIVMPRELALPAAPQMARSEPLSTNL